VSDHDTTVTKTILLVLTILAAMAISFYFIAATVTSDDGAENEGPNPRQLAKVQENIKPVGQVNTGPVVVAAVAESTGPRSGDQVYNASCLACHSTGVAGAPKVGDNAAWGTRAASGMDAMMNNAINGINAMPAKGTCATCSDDELKAAIEYMLKESGV
jgi:cytochrome c5